MQPHLSLFGPAIVVVGLFASPERRPTLIESVASTSAPARRPTRAPGSDPAPSVLEDEPTTPALDDALRAAVEQRARDAREPGLAAFEAYADAYVDANLSLVERKARDEGLTVAEVRALTHLGLLALASQRVDDVEAILGRPLDDAERDGLAELLADASDGLEHTLRTLVARGADVRARWEVIDAARTSYLEAYFGLTGMDRDGLAELLAGDLLRSGARAAPGRAPPAPRSHAPVGPVDPVDPQRPR